MHSMIHPFEMVGAFLLSNMSLFNLSSVSSWLALASFLVCYLRVRVGHLLVCIVGTTFITLIRSTVPRNLFRTISVANEMEYEELSI